MELWKVRHGAKCMELIDTLWNVNYFIFGNFIKGDRELIDTLWNVNNLKDTTSIAR